MTAHERQTLAKVREILHKIATNQPQENTGEGYARALGRSDALAMDAEIRLAVLMDRKKGPL